MYPSGPGLPDPGADRTAVAASTASENGVTLQNVEISLWQKQGGRSGYAPEGQQWPVRSEMVVAYGCMHEDSAENPCLIPAYRVQ